MNKCIVHIFIFYDVAVGAGGVLVEVVDVVDMFVVTADLTVKLADSAELPDLQPHPFAFQIPLVGKFNMLTLTYRWLHEYHIILIIICL